jgi:hypothetical protein
MHVNNKPTIEADSLLREKESLDCSVLPARAMPALPTELWALVVRAFCESMVQDAMRRAHAFDIDARDPASVRKYAKPRWADVQPLSTSSRALRSLALEQWFSVLVVPVYLDEVSANDLLAFPARFQPRWVRYAVTPRHHTQPTRLLTACGQSCIHRHQGSRQNRKTQARSSRLH